MKIIVLILMFVMSGSVCVANPSIVSETRFIGESMKIQEWAHLGVGYIVNDQLMRHTQLTTLERIGVVAIVSMPKSIGNSITVHEWAHFGVGYVINDQLKRHTQLTTLERIGVVAFGGYAKEKWIDRTFTRNQLLATVAGSLVYEVKF